MAEKRKINGRKVPRGIYKDKNGYVWVRIFNRGRPVKKLIGKEADRDVLLYAAEKLAYLKKERRMGRLGLESELNRITMEEACDLYWTQHASKKLSARTYRFQLRNIKAFFVGRYADTISASDVEAFRAKRTADGVKGSSINKEHTIITHLFNLLRKLRREGVIRPVKLPEDNPGSLVKKENEKKFRRKVVLTRVQFEELWANSTIRVRRSILAAVQTLLRTKDLKGLSSEAINTETGQLEGVQAKTQKPFTIPITKDMEELIGSASGKTILSFKNHRNEWDRARTRSGLKHVQFRDLRRTAARWLLKSGIDIGVVSAMLGHTTITMTQDYVQAEKEDLKVASGVLGTVFAKPTLENVPKTVP